MVNRGGQDLSGPELIITDNRPQFLPSQQQVQRPAGRTCRNQGLRQKGIRRHSLFDPSRSRIQQPHKGNTEICGAAYTDPGISFSHRLWMLRQTSKLRACGAGNDRGDLADRLWATHDLRVRLPAAILLMFLLASASHAASANSPLRAVIDEIRAQGCGGHVGVKPALRPDPRLDRVAAELASGGSLRAALLGAGYRAVQSATLEASGSAAGIASALAKRACKDIVNPVFRDIGVDHRGDEAWIVLAAPQVPPAPDEAQAVSRRMLELVNEARAGARRCGWKRFRAAAPVVLSDALQQAALAHARDMAAHSSLSHAGRDGSTAGERATRVGYRWRLIGENIAAGQSTPEQVVADWVQSSRHCANLMSADFSEMGVAFAVEPRSVSGIYWTQLFASPRAGN
ncbi:MAG: CAP domain-containing protein [Steroidobacteraceae bacterium]